MIYTSPWGERVFAQTQPDIWTIPNSGGVWNPAGAQYIRVTEDSFKMQPDEPKIPTNIKHGTTSQLPRIMARKSATWSLNVPITPSGIQAVPPDTDVLWQAIFGGVGVLRTGTPFGNAWQYNVYDQRSRPLFIPSFQHLQPATGNRYVLGALPTQVSIDFNGNILGMSVNGVGVAAMENESFGGLPTGDVVPYGGLGAYPTEPGSFSSNGTAINAFGGNLWINGQSFSYQCDTFTVRHNTGMGLKGNFIDSAYAGAVVYNSRSTSVNLGFVNNDSAQIATLKRMARLNSTVKVEFYLGAQSGYRLYVQVNGVQFTPGTLSDSAGYTTVSFGESSSSVAAGQSDDLFIGFA